jgi:hypothetical protein
MANELSVFISHGTDTRPLAEELTRALESQGIEAWVDFKDLRPGQRWKDELERAIGDAQWFLILVGSGNRATAWQEAEWSTALARTWTDRDKRLLPIVFGQTEPPPFLRNWVSLRVDPTKEPSTWTRHVLDALRSARNEAIHGVDVQNRRERQRRLDEIRRVAEELRESPPDEPLIATPKVHSE